MTLVQRETLSSGLPVTWVARFDQISLQSTANRLGSLLAFWRDPPVDGSPLRCRNDPAGGVAIAGGTGGAGDTRAGVGVGAGGAGWAARAAGAGLGAGVAGRAAAAVAVAGGSGLRGGGRPPRQHPRPSAHDITHEFLGLFNSRPPEPQTRV